MSMLEGHRDTDLQAMREQVAQTDGAPEELYLGIQVAGLRGICYRAECK